MTDTAKPSARDLFAIVQAWRTHTENLACPSCQSGELQIKDVSARPHTEWYRLTCKACEFDKTITRPLAAHR